MELAVKRLLVPLLLVFLASVSFLVYRERSLVTNYALRKIDPKNHTSYQMSLASENFTIDFGVQVPPEVRKQVIEKLALATDKSNKKTILIWYPPWGYAGEKKEDISSCGYCEYTYDHNKINDASTAAVVFHFLEIAPNTMPPLAKRNYNQLYIFWTMEGTPYMRFTSGKNLEFEDSYKFNATMSYRRDSDFLTAYGQISTMTSLFSDSPIDDILKYKSKLAIVVVSNCDLTPGARRRHDIIEEILSLGYKLDTFGRCYPKSGQLPRDGSFMETLKKYKFYLSFENSYHCQDYITEKYFHNALHSFSLPVIWGGKKEDYEAVSPPHSFVHLDDFNSTKGLLEYLEYLDKNTSAYLEYFRWHHLKPKDMPEFGRKSGFCQICRVVHGINIDDVFNPHFNPTHPVRPLLSDGLYPRTVPSVKDYFYTQENEDCFKKQFN